MSFRRYGIGIAFEPLAATGAVAAGAIGMYAKSDNCFYKKYSDGEEYKIWDSGNHGPGSGLNADLLDGQHASEFAPAVHTHSNYVLKTGDTMSGDLHIVKQSGSYNAEAYYRVAAQDISGDATQAWFEVYSELDKGYYLLHAIRTQSSVATSYNMLYGEFSAIKGSRLVLGSNKFDNLSIVAATDVVSNANYVFVEDVDGWVKRVPVSSFGGGGGSGTVTSVGLSMPNIFSVTGSPVTTSGVLTAALVSQARNTVLAAPVLNSGVPTFRKLDTSDLPDLSGMFDYYGSWNMQVDSGTTKLIAKTGTTQYQNIYNGIKLIAGSNITLSESNANGALGIKIDAASGGGGLSYSEVALNQSPAPINANTWTDIPTMSLTSFGSGSYLVNAIISVTKGTTGTGLVAARIIDNANTVLATAEMYHYTTTTNRVSFCLSAFLTVGGLNSTVRLQIWSNTTGWSAIATTIGSNSPKATTLSILKIS